jgi:hypothetical protein
MATSGTSLYTLQIDEIAEEAFERIGVLQPTGNDLRSARRSLNLLLQELGNRGELLWSTETTTLGIPGGSKVVTLAADTLAVTTVTVRRTGSTDNEIWLNPVTSEDYRLFPNKDQTGRPVAYVYNRERDAGSITLWPVPDAAYDVTFERRRRLHDITQYTETLDIPSRFLPAIIAGLAWALADKRPALVDQARRGELQLRWESEIDRALSEDRERVSLVLIPEVPA